MIESLYRYFEYLFDSGKLSLAHTVFVNEIIPAVKAGEHIPLRLVGVLGVLK